MTDSPDLFPADTTREFTYDELIACARREVEMRARVYPNQVRNGRMTKPAMDLEIAMMQAIVDVLEIVKNRDGQVQPKG